MPTINKNIATELIHNDGHYKDDPVVMKIVTYNNMFNNGLEYACVYEGQDMMRYENSPACHNVKTLWVKS